MGKHKHFNDWQLHTGTNCTVMSRAMYIVKKQSMQGNHVVTSFVFSGMLFHAPKLDVNSKP
jgi:hypothetical protein